MSDEEKALLRAICEVPADDAPRLIYADWLDEHDRGEQAEFIRLSLAIPKIHHCGSVTDHWCPVCGDCCCPHPEDGLDDGLCPLHSPLSLHGGLAEVAAKVADYHYTHYSSAQIGTHWNRGFAHVAHVEHDDFLRIAKSAFQTNPITEVVLTGISPIRVPIEGNMFGIEGLGNTWYYRRWKIGPKFGHNLDWRIFDKLPSPRLYLGCAFYATRETAEDAVSVAALAFGREEAGLSPLK